MDDETEPGSRWAPRAGCSPSCCSSSPSSSSSTRIPSGGNTPRASEHRQRAGRPRLLRRPPERDPGPGDAEQHRHRLLPLVPRDAVVGSCESRGGAGAGLGDRLGRRARRRRADARRPHAHRDLHADDQPAPGRDRPDPLHRRGAVVRLRRRGVHDLLPRGRRGDPPAGAHWQVARRAWRCSRRRSRSSASSRPTRRSGIFNPATGGLGFYAHYVAFVVWLFLASAAMTLAQRRRTRRPRTRGPCGRPEGRRAREARLALHQAVPGRDRGPGRAPGADPDPGALDDEERRVAVRAAAGGGTERDPEPAGDARPAPRRPQPLRRRSSTARRGSRPPATSPR